MEDFELHFECKDCGWTFSRNFRSLPHGKPVKCQFCGETLIDLKGWSPVAAHEEMESHDASSRGLFREVKIKV